MLDWRDAVASAELARGKPIRVVVDGDAVLLLKVDDQVFAVGNQCTHQGAGSIRAWSRSQAP
jgi:nitrite reductase/ring-hydroxylating ferredoxin subunit